jgi:hypothetical protein
MSDQQPDPHAAQTPRAPQPYTPQPYAPPHAREVSVTYRRWANVLVWAAAVIAVLVVVALVASFVLLAQADADVDNAALGYLAIFLWFGIVAAVPVLLGIGIPGLVMKRRVRQQDRASAGL